MRHTIPAWSRAPDLGPKFREFCRGPIGSKDHLAAFAHQGVDRVEELDLRGPFAAEELKVVDQQELDATVLLAETGQPASPQGLEEMGGELFGREIDGPRGRSLSAPPTKSLPASASADARWTVDHQRRVCPGRWTIISAAERANRLHAPVTKERCRQTSGGVWRPGDQRPWAICRSPVGDPGVVRRAGTRNRARPPNLDRRGTRWTGGVPSTWTYASSIS